MAEVLILGSLSALGFIIIIFKMRRSWLRQLLKYDIAFDILITLSFMLFMAGTFTGAMVAVVSGIFISIILLITKWIVR